MDQHGNTPLYYAVKNMHPEMVSILLNMGADVNKRCEMGNTVMHECFMIGEKIDKNRKVLNTLMLSGPNLKATNNFG